MNFDKMSSKDIANYTCASDENRAEVRKWMNSKQKEINRLSKWSVAISIIAIVIAIIFTLLKLLS